MDALVRAIGVVQSPRREAVDDDWGNIEASITLVEGFGPDALRGLESFSHVEVLFLFHQVDPGVVETGARRPRSNPAWPQVGIFTQRGKDRPNRIGSTICEIVRVKGTSVVIRGLDAIDGTPVLDLKPVLSGFLPRGPVVEPSWSLELMAGYWGGDHLANPAGG